MNKQELKSLLENIYTALNEAESSPHMTPEGPDGEVIPWDYRPYDPSLNRYWTPPDMGYGYTWRYENGHWIVVPPAPTPQPKPPTLPNAIPPRIRFPVNPGDSISDWDPGWYPPWNHPFRQALRDMGIEDEFYPSLFN